MSSVQFYAVHGGDLTELPVPTKVGDVHQLFAGSQLEPVAAVYSALRSYGGNRFLRLGAHLERCRLSVERAGWSTHFAMAGLARALGDAVASPRDGNVRIRFDLFERPITVAGTTAQVLLGLAPHQAIPEEVLELGAALGLAPPGLARKAPLIKFADWVTARRVCEQDGTDAYEYLLLDEERRILEGTSSNFYAVRNGRLITAADGILEGITRQIVLERAEQCGLALERRRLHLDELNTIEEAFITSSTREIVPVRSVGERPIGAGKPGSVTLSLLRDYRHYALEHAQLASKSWAAP